MKTMVWTLSLVLFLMGSTAFAKEGSGKKDGQKKKGSQCVKPSPKYGGQDCKKKGNNGHGNNEDGVDSSNPGKSKKGEDTDPGVDDEKKS